MATQSDTHVREVPCPLCGGTRVSPVLRDAGSGRIDRSDLVACTSLDHGAFGQIVACDGCGIQFRSPREDDATILSYYAGVEDAVYQENEPARVATFSKALTRLEAHVPIKGPLLDVGCYTGVFLDVAASRGWPVVGLEPSRWAAEAARKKGHEVHCGTLDSAALPRGHFAVATMWDAIEHYADPVKELRQARALVRDGGYLVLSTMRNDTWVARLLGRRWPWYMRMHLYYFTPRTLERALALAGWQLVHLHGYSHVVTWDYLLLKLGPYTPRTSAAGRRMLGRLGLSARTISIDLGDFMTAYARKGPA
ncbi:MAG TPA: class I SAM-dependent methyltransferase [Methylomirabilota bacterium]|nr:class I SAM-dependent methyltransferase [Methylomirabilota bacterium]